MTLACKIGGEFAQSATCQIDLGQSLFADATKFRWKTTNVTMETRLSTPRDDAKAKGGFVKSALSTAVEVGKRALAGQSLAFQWFTPSGGSGLVGLAGEMPGQIRVIELDGSLGWRTESRAFVAAESSVAYDIDFSGLNLGRRSKQGLIFEHFSGVGTLIVGGGGTLHEINPANYGGTVQVHGGAVVGFSDAITFGVQRVGALNAQTLTSAVFGGQGLNLVTLSGDGVALLQTTLHREFEADERGEDQTVSPLRDGLLGRL